jgi:hypothetical protein
MIGDKPVPDSVCYKVLNRPHRDLRGHRARLHPVFNLTPDPLTFSMSD